MEEATEKDDKKDICRVCLTFDCKDTGKRVSLFDTYNNAYIYEKLNYIASIEIKKDDKMPDRICSACLLALENACQFKQQCENSDAILHSSLQLQSLQEQYIELPVKEETEENEYEYDFLDSPYNDDKDLLSNAEDTIENQSEEVPFKSKAIDLKLECHDCGDIFKSKCKLRVHWKKVHLPQQLICPICKKAHKTYKSFHNHLKRKAKVCVNAAKVRVEGEGRARIFYCKDCDAKSKRLQTILTHIVIHTGERPFVCNICGKSYSQASSVIGHKEAAHNVNVKVMTCPHCGLHFNGRGKWYKHMKRHNYVKSPCPVCKKIFSSKQSLQVHMKRHSGNKSLTCEYCAKTFYVSSDLRNHKVKIHFKNKIYSCHICNYKSRNHGCISKHRKRHTDSNVACDICGRFLENEQQLMLHKKRHFEKNFKCSLCDKTYYGKKNLSNHIRKIHNMYGVATASSKIEVKRDIPSM